MHILISDIGDILRGRPLNILWSCKGQGWKIEQRSKKISSFWNICLSQEDEVYQYNQGHNLYLSLKTKTKPDINKKQKQKLNHTNLK